MVPDDPNLPLNIMEIFVRVAILTPIVKNYPCFLLQVNG
jgi:hypothetical protein